MLRAVVFLAMGCFPVLMNTECLWAVGKVICKEDSTRVKDTVFEVWDKDGPKEVGVVDALDADDMAALTVIESDGLFRVEGCASDIDWLGPLHRNRPEFYFKIRHRCQSDRWKEMTIFPPKGTVVVAPLTMDYYMEHPIELV